MSQPHRREAEWGCRWSESCGEHKQAQCAVCFSSMRGTQVLQPGFVVDQEPRDAAGEVSPSVTVAMAVAKPLLMSAGMAQLPHSPQAPSLSVGRALGVHTPSHSHYLLPFLTRSQSSRSTKHPCWHWHRVGAQDCHCLQAVPTAVTLGTSAVRRQHSAPSAWPWEGSQPPAVKHVSRVVRLACPLVIVMAVSPVPCRVSWDMRTTRTPGCSGWAPAIASSPWGSARYGPHQEGSPGAIRVPQPHSLQPLCQGSGCSSGGLSPMKAGDPLAR